MPTTSILNWRPEWTLEIDILDKDHRNLVDRLADIARQFGPTGSSQGDSRAAAKQNLIAELERLGEEAREHFHREEEFMRSIDYPRLAAHHKEHAVLAAEFAEFVRNLRERGAARLEEEDVSSLKQWLIAHVLGQDRGFANHYFQLFAEEET